jgi:hypothetical protein
MEEQWVIDRAKLRQLLHEQPNGSVQQYAQTVGRSRKWVQKWKHRLQGTRLDDDGVLHSWSRARRRRPEPYHPEVIARILELRDNPPDTVPRKLGAPAIRYFLHQDAQLQAKGYRLPRSTCTIHKILTRHQRILHPLAVEHTLFERPPAMDTWEIDFTDVPGAQGRSPDKLQHQVEAFAVVDRGSSILVDLQSSDEYHTETALVAIASTLVTHGLPHCVVMDRDPRLVGSSTSDEFPSAVMRFLLNLGITLDICPPHRPDLKPFVERYFRTLKTECIQVKQPVDVAQTREAFAQHHATYNHERPNQSKVCGNRPPFVAFPILPILPSIPIQVNPDAWLLSCHRRLFKRRVTANGTIQIDRSRYYVQRDLVGRYVLCKLDAHRQVFEISLDNRLVKTVPIRGLYHDLLEFGLYLDLMLKEATAEQRRLRRKQRLRAA